MNESTFRSLFRKAIGESSYPPELSNRVDRLINGRDAHFEPNPRRNRWLSRVGRMGSAVAAVLVVLLVGSVVVGIRVWLDRDIFNTSPGTRTPGVNSAELAQLEARPLSLPVVQQGASCPVTPGTAIDIGSPYDLFTHFGGGPVYVLARAGGGHTSTTWGDYYDLTYAADPQVTGVVLIRIHDIRNNRDGVFVGRFVSGDGVGTDTTGTKAVRQYGELVLDASHPPMMSPNKWGLWDVRQGWAAGFSGCYGIQIDGVGFTEVIVRGN